MASDRRVLRGLRAEPVTALEAGSVTACIHIPMTRANPAARSEGDGCTETWIAGGPEGRADGRLQHLTSAMGLENVSRCRSKGMEGY